MNSWLMSGYVNLRAAGLSLAAAKALILTSVATDQTIAATAIDAKAANCTTLAGLAYGARASNGANTIGYTTDGPYMTYEHI